MLIKKMLLTFKVRAGRIRPPLPILKRVKRKIKKKNQCKFFFFDSYYVILLFSNKLQNVKESEKLNWPSYAQILCPRSLFIKSISFPRVGLEETLVLFGHDFRDLFVTDCL